MVISHRYVELEEGIPRWFLCPRFLGSHDLGFRTKSLKKQMGFCPSFDERLRQASRWVTHLSISFPVIYIYIHIYYYYHVYIEM